MNKFYNSKPDSSGNPPIITLKSSITYEYDINDIHLRKTSLGIGNIIEIEYNELKENSLVFETNKSCIGIYFNIGDAVQLIASSNNNLLLKKMHHNSVRIHKDSPYRLVFDANGHYKIFQFQLKSAYLSTLYETHPLLEHPINDFEGQNTNHCFGESQYITLFMKKVMEEINTCNYTGQMRKLFLETKIQEILILQLTMRKNISGERLKQQAVIVKDREILFAAKKHIDENFRKPLTIVKLARYLGTNDHKLKKGFKDLFGLTIFKYLQNVRMEHARSMLANGTSINDISYFIGYSNISNFSNAFRSHHGFTPGDYMK